MIEHYGRVLTLRDARADFERTYIREVLQHVHWSRRRAATQLGISLDMLERRISKYKIRRLPPGSGSPSAGAAGRPAARRHGSAGHPIFGVRL